MKNKLKFNLGISIFLLITLSLFVSAIGATAPFWDTKPLGMKAGEMMEFPITLQNNVGNSDVILKADIVDGAEIVTLTDEITEYDLPLGSKNIPVNIKIQIPENAPVGQEYTIGILFSQVIDKDLAEGQMVKITGGVKSVIPVIIESPTGAAVKEVGKISPVGMLIILALIITAVLIYLVKRNKYKV